MCSRTIYCTNIDKKVISTFQSRLGSRTRTGVPFPDFICLLVQVTQADVKLFFESLCGEVGSSFCDKF